MKRKISLSAFLCAVSLCCYSAISLPSDHKVKVWQPQAFSASVLKWNVADSIANSKGYGQQPAPTSANRRIWVVYSDRDNNSVYESPSKSARKLDRSYSLKMNDKVRIADIQSGFALVYKEPSEAVTYPEISEYAVVIGWVPMSNLVLWRTCPADNHGIYRKAILALNADKYKKGMSVGKYYTNPSDKTGGASIETGMTFFYIMKEDKETGLTLLAKEYNLDITGTQLYGWVDDVTILPWNQRSCLEPNWNETDIKTLKSSPATIYGDASMSASSKLTSWNYGKVQSEGKVTPYRMDGKVLRFPILDSDKNSKSDSYKCTYFGTVGSNTSLDQIAKKETEARRLMNARIEKMRVMNLIIVIDGTRSMEEYYQPVQKAILKACDDMGGNYIPKVGLVIYRDYADGKDDPENGLVEYFEMQDPKSQELTANFKTGGSYGVKSSKNDNTNDEAVYQGIMAALDMEEMGYTEENSNLLVVIGDCGNDPSYESKYGPTQSSIIDKCIENNVNFLVFQVHKSPIGTGAKQNFAESTYRYTEQMNDILMKSMESKYKALSDKAKVHWEATTNGYDLLPSKELGADAFFLGATRFPDNDNLVEVIDASELQSMLTANILSFKELIDKNMQKMHNFIDYSKSNLPQGTTVGEEMQAGYIESIFGEENTAILAYNQTLVTVTGYTKKYVPDSDPAAPVEYWKPVIFISKPELDALLERLQFVLSKSETAGTNMNEVRKRYVDAMKSILRSMLPGITEAEMDAKTPDEVVALIAGLNESTKQLSGRPLREISDPKLCPDKEFNTIIASYKSKVNKLKNVIRDKKAYIYDYLDVNNYWVPIEDLP